MLENLYNLEWFLEEYFSRRHFMYKFSIWSKIQIPIAEIPKYLSEHRMDTCWTISVHKAALKCFSDDLQFLDF